MSSSPLLTVKQLAEALNCSPTSIYRMIRDESIPFYNFQSSYRFDLDKVLKALANK